MKKSILQKKIVVSAFSKEGKGVGYLEENQSQTRVEIPHSIPGDIVLADLYRKKKGKRKARLLKILQPSQNRCEQKCIHATICGGCACQSLSYDKQLEEKQKRVYETFLAHFHKNSFELFSIIPSKQIWLYRNKMEFSFSENKAETKFLGLMIAGASRYVFNVEECFLASKWFYQVVKCVRKWWEDSSISAYNMSHNTGSLRTLTLREGKKTKEKMVVLTASGHFYYALNKKQLEAFVSAIISVIGKDQISIFLRIQKIEKKHPTQFSNQLLYGLDHIKETLLLNYQNQQKELIFYVSPSSFFQPNTYQAEILYNKAIELAQPKKSDVVFDLYCGVGSIGMSFSLFVKQVNAIEFNPDAVVDAEKNKELNHINNFFIHQGECGKVLIDLIQKKDFVYPDIVIVDPPRCGLHNDALEQIVCLNPKKIIYISCNPITQSENISYFSDKGYKLAKMVPVDQFPHTMHIENIALLYRI